MSLSGTSYLRYKQQAALGTAIADGSLTFIEVLGDAVPVTPEVAQVDRGTQRGDNETNLRLLGPQNTGVAFSTYMKGCGTTGADGVAPVAAVELTELFDAVFGAAVSTTGQGDTTDAVDAGTAATVIMDGAPGTPIATGNAVLVKGTTSGKYVAREVESLSTATYTVCRTLTDDTGATDTAAEGEIAYASATWYLNVDNGDHDFLHFSYEGETTRYDALGCTAQSLRIAVPDNGGYVTCEFAFDGNTFTEPALSGDAFSLAAGGSPIQAVDSPVWIGATPYFARGLVVNIALNTVRKSTPHGVNGYHGHAVTSASVSVEGMLYQGSGTFEAAKALKATVEAPAAQDVLIQVGRAAGAAMAIRLPAADVTLTPTTTDGQDMYSFSAIGTRSDDQTNRPGPVRLHLF